MYEKLLSIALSINSSIIVFIALKFIKNKYDFKKIEKLLLMAVEKDDNDCKSLLSFLYFKEKINKEKSLELSKLAFDKENNFVHLFNLNINLLWNNQIQESMDLMPVLLSNEDIDENVSFLGILFLLLIAKKQYNYVFNLFKDKDFNLKERFKPIYYALMYFMQDKYPDEYIRMGSDLKETVEEIIEKIKEMSIDYA